jgi:1-acyl-sn-glycerol-3-phosphate acyltransferase
MKKNIVKEKSSNAGAIRKYWIVTATIFVTLMHSIKIWFLAVVLHSSRHKIDIALRAWVKKLLHIARISYKVFNQEHVKFAHNQAYIVMSNHASHYDIPLIFAAIDGSVRMMAKKELFRVPIWGHAMRAAEFISIDREDRRQAVKDLRAAKEKMQSGIIPWIAPEGTRSRSGKMQEFKKGGFLLALQTDANIIPVGIRGSFNILPPGTTDFNLNQHVEIHIGVPIDTSKYSTKDIAKLMAEVEARIKVLAGQA